MGGWGGYTYAWSTSPVQTGATATGLTAGNYTVTVTDVEGCATTCSITVTEPAVALSCTASETNKVTCIGGNDGEATVTPGGGWGGYIYAWSTSPIQTGATATGLMAGSYTVTVTDSNGCEA